MRTAFVLGGTGLIGRALVPLLRRSGYEVIVGTRAREAPPPPGVRHVRLDRDLDEDFDHATAGDHDLFVDLIAYNERHAEQLRRLRGQVGSLVVISSAAVYADPNGRTLLGSTDASGTPITENDPVVAAIPEGTDYAGGKVAVERTLLESDLPVTILRPGAIFGPGDRASREWHFVKRVLDGRRVIPLAFGGSSIFHHVSSTNVASMIGSAGRIPGTRVVNCGDPDPRDIRRIGEAVATAMDHQWEIVPLPGPPIRTVGDTPWSVPVPFVMDLSAARDELGFQPEVAYERSLEETCEWLVAETRTGPWQDVLPKAAIHYSELFDYDAEDDFLVRLRRG